MNIRYWVMLDEAERAELREMLSGGKHAARKIKRAQILLAADVGVSDEDIACAIGVGGSTVYRTKRRFVEGNLEAALRPCGRITESLIPAVLTNDRCPISSADGLDTIWIIDEELPCRRAGLDDIVVSVPDQVAELVGPQVSPDVLHRVQLWSVRRQVQQHDVVGHLQFTASVLHGP